MADGLDYDEFYSGTFRRVVVQIYAMTGNLAEAEDSVQEAYARAWQQWGTLSKYGNPEAWVRTVAHRISVSAWRKAVSRLAAHHRHGPPPDVPGLGPDHLALVAALRQISAAQRQVIVLFYLAGRSVEEITTETGMPGGTVKSHLSRGRRAMAPFLTESTASSQEDQEDQPAPATETGANTITEAPRAYTGRPHGRSLTMSDNLTRLLSELADMTSARIEPPGADAARKRGRQRTARRRLTAGALVLALAAGATGIAAVTGGPGAGRHPAAGSGPTTSATSSATSGTNRTPEPSATPTPAPVLGNLDTIVPGAWASPDQFPFESLAQWRPAWSNPPSILVGNTQVWYATCTGYPVGAVGFQTNIYNSRVLQPYPFQGGYTGYLARETLFFFPSAAAAHAALNAVATAYAHCPAMTGVLAPANLVSTVAPTGQTQDGYAWLHTFRYVNVPESGGLQWTPDMHEYFVQRGNVLALADVEGNDLFDSTSQDQQFLETLAAHLGVYGG